MGNTLQKLPQNQKAQISEPPRQKDEISESQEPDSDFTCEICIEIVSANNKFKNRSMCKHDFCSDCIAKYIEAKVLEYNIANISCPALDCEFSLDPISCRPVISNHLFNKWCDLLCSATVLEYYSDRSVYCPYRDCSALIVNECNDKVDRSTCPNCKKKFCFRCKSPWHAGYGCREKRMFRDKNDVLAGQLIEKMKWTRCPKCRNAVERKGGCMLIDCRCGNLFCHACGKEINRSPPTIFFTGVRQACCTQVRRFELLFLTFRLIVISVLFLSFIILIVRIS
ncbi:hypothetical protein POUND7_019771 [Theobroma cacao]